MCPLRTKMQDMTGGDPSKLQNRCVNNYYSDQKYYSCTKNRIFVVMTNIIWPTPFLTPIFYMQFLDLWNDCHVQILKWIKNQHLCPCRRQTYKRRYNTCENKRFTPLKRNCVNEQIIAKSFSFFLYFPDFFKNCYLKKSIIKI